MPTLDPRDQCQALTNDGRGPRCKNSAKANGFCYLRIHQEQAPPSETDERCMHVYKDGNRCLAAKKRPSLKCEMHSSGTAAAPSAAGPPRSGAAAMPATSSTDTSSEVAVDDELEAAVRDSWFAATGQRAEEAEVAPTLKEVAPMLFWCVDTRGIKIARFVDVLEPASNSTADKRDVCKRILSNLVATGNVPPEQMNTRTARAVVELFNRPLRVAQDEFDAMNNTDGSGDGEDDGTALVYALHLMGTMKCTAKSHGLSSWIDYFEDTAGIKERMCAFQFVSGSEPGRRYYKHCTGVAKVGAHIKALQRLWIVPACNKCNSAQGKRAYVFRDILKCPLPPSCLHIFVNGDHHPEDAEEYGVDVAL